MTVDGVVYKCDLMERTVSQAPPPPLLQQVRAIIDKKRGARVDSPTNTTMTTNPGQVNFV